MTTQATILEAIGWSPEVNNEEMITVIRRQVRYDEVVMTRKEFEQMNQQLLNDEYDEDLELDVRNKLDSSMKDIEYTEPVEYHYTAIVGDVTSCTDDVIFTAPLEWTDGDDLVSYGVELCETGALESMMRK
jgi:hypothetical protein